MSLELDITEQIEDWIYDSVERSFERSSHLSDDENDAAFDREVQRRIKNITVEDIEKYYASIYTNEQDMIVEEMDSGRGLLLDAGVEVELIGEEDEIR